MRFSVISRKTFILALLASSHYAVAAGPLSTAFTYQGKLESSGTPVNGTADFKFTLWDAVSGVSQVAGPVAVDNVTVTGGLFTVSIDFDAEIFNGDARWLEVAASTPAGGGSFTTLTPRQPLTAVPYALQTRGLFFEDGASRVGIGTTTPTHRLTVDGGGLFVDDTAEEGVSLSSAEFVFENAETQNLAYRYRSSPEHHDYFIGGALAMILDATGNLGIGTGTPTSRLHVQSAGATGILGTNTSAGSNPVAIRGDATSPISAGAVGVYGLTAGPGGTGVYGSCTYTAGALSYGVRGTMAGTGGYGVRGDATGATGPTGGVYGTVLSTAGRGVVGEATAATGTTFGLYGSSTSSTGRGVYGTATNASGVNYGIYGQTASASGYAGYFAGGKNYFEGNVGIGVSNPIAKLDVTDDSGNALNVVHTGDSGHVAQFYVGASDAASGLYSVTYGGGYAGSFEAHNTNSAAALNCYKNGGPALLCRSTLTAGGTAATDCVVAMVGGSDTEPTGGGYLVLGGVAGTNISIDNNEIMARSAGAVAPLALNADGGNVNLIQGGTGNVGIGTSNPVSKLHVNGTARCDVLEIVGADLAEKFPVSDETKPGMVVMIDAENPGKLCLARGAYNKGVAGVVSGANGLPAGTVLGHLPGSEKSPPIALSGRVWVYCDARERAVEVTDLLTTSETPGHAMAALDATRSHGAVIGKAMTGLAKGEQGLVLVLVNLQ